MATLLYVFPHPDDESFGPAPVLARQLRAGHEVHLLTLTRGGATKKRHDYGYTVQQMGAVRLAEMERVAETLGLSSLTVLDLPDGGLVDLDPRFLEETIAAHVRRLDPDVVVTYAFHGNSHHADHIGTHAAVKRVFCAEREAAAPARRPRRLALFTLVAPVEDGPDHLRGSDSDRIDCVEPFAPEDRARAEAALACYKTYRDVVEAHDPLQQVEEGVAFELFHERHRPRLSDLTDQLPV
jgi:LmbE family N-acetylglucosaminyl deacetylase